MQLEGPEAEVVWFVVGARDRCGGPGGVERMVPQIVPLLEAKGLEVQVHVVGERAPLLRVPAKDRRVFPPTTWEKALLPVDRVLVAVVVKRAQSGQGLRSVSAVRGDLPEPAHDGLELLRLEYVLPPATKQAGAERAMQTALRKLAEAMQLPLLPGPQMLRQVVVQHGSVLANLAVPRAQALGSRTVGRCTCARCSIERRTTGYFLPVVRSMFDRTTGYFLPVVRSNIERTTGSVTPTTTQRTEGKKVRAQQDMHFLAKHGKENN